MLQHLSNVGRPWQTYFEQAYDRPSSTIVILFTTSPSPHFYCPFFSLLIFFLSFGSLPPTSPLPPSTVVLPRAFSWWAKLIFNLFHAQVGRRDRIRFRNGACFGSCSRGHQPNPLTLTGRLSRQFRDWQEAHLDITHNHSPALVVFCKFSLVTMSKCSVEMYCTHRTNFVPFVE